jgi:hypothetical protein
MKLFTTILMTLGMISGANAAFYSRAGGTMVYDDVLNITWLADWNYAKTSGYSVANAGGSGTTAVLSNGWMGWGAAKTWASGISFAGFDDWRLPSGDGLKSAGRDNEFLSVWISSGSTIYGLESIFKNVQNNLDLGLPPGEYIPPFYWSSSEYQVTTQGMTAWIFAPSDGLGNSDGGQGLGVISSNVWYAAAVRDGDVADVPVTATLALLGLGLAGIARRSRSTGKGAAR